MGDVTLLRQSCVLALDFPSSFGERHASICYAMPCRLSSEAERGSAQSFHTSTPMNQREDPNFHIKCSAKEDAENSV